MNIINNFFQCFLSTININGKLSTTTYKPLCLKIIVNIEISTYPTMFLFLAKNSSVLNISSMFCIINKGIIPENNMSFHIVILYIPFTG